MSDSNKETMTIEESFEKLNEIIEVLEDEKVSLEDSIAAYEQGMKLVKQCNDVIDLAEKKVLVIRENGELDEF